MYLQGKDNVAVLAKTHSKKLIIDKGKATGVEVLGPDGETYKFSANYEVIVSQGVFESPKLLMLSGIGPEKGLQDFGLSPVVASEHVGQNLLDHPIMPHVFRLKDGLGLDGHLLRPGLAHDAAVSAYANKNKGPYTSGLLELVGLPRIDAWLDKDAEYVARKKANGGVDPFGPDGQPHFEIDFVPMFSDAFQWHIPCPAEGDWLTVIVDLLRPQSRNGTVTLHSTDPLAQPKVNIGFFENHIDLVAMRQGVRFVDDLLMNGEGMKDILGEDYPWPMPRHSDEAMETMIKERSQTGFHPCGTLRMGKNIEQGVVDSKLKVFGVDKLRIIDASVIPVIPDCRIQNAVYMIGEKVRWLVLHLGPYVLKRISLLIIYVLGSRLHQGCLPKSVCLNLVRSGIFSLRSTNGKGLAGASSYCFKIIIGSACLLHPLILKVSLVQFIVWLGTT